MGIVPWGMVLLLWGVLRLGRDGGQAIVETARRASYDGDEVPKSSGVVAVDGLTSSGLKPREKWALARPLLLPFMLPLFCVYVFEVRYLLYLLKYSPLDQADPSFLSACSTSSTLASHLHSFTPFLHLAPFSPGSSNPLVTSTLSMP
jgi:hypothetical protein